MVQNKNIQELPLLTRSSLHPITFYFFIFSSYNTSSFTKRPWQPPLFCPITGAFFKVLSLSLLFSITISKLKPASSVTLLKYTDGVMQCHLCKAGADYDLKQPNWHFVCQMPTPMFPHLPAHLGIPVRQLMTFADGRLSTRGCMRSSPFGLPRRFES